MLSLHSGNDLLNIKNERLMKRMVLVIAAVLSLLAGTASAQVVFYKFKFTKDSPFGVAPTRKGLDVKFKNTSGRTIKKVSILYSGVNDINEAVSSDIVGGVNANAKHTKYRLQTLTGPIEPGKTPKTWLSAVFWSRQKVRPFPQKVTVVYMDNSEDVIPITKENIKAVFPCLEWVEVDYEHGL